MPFPKAFLRFIKLRCKLRLKQAIFKIWTSDTKRRSSWNCRYAFCRACPNPIYEGSEALKETTPEDVHPGNLLEHMDLWYLEITPVFMAANLKETVNILHIEPLTQHSIWTCQMPFTHNCILLHWNHSQPVPKLLFYLRDSFNDDECCFTRTLGFDLVGPDVK